MGITHPMKSSLRIALAIAACCLGTGLLAAPAARIPLSHGLVAGPHAVGFRVVHRFDTSRDFKRAFEPDGSATVGERARPMQIGFWYPCRKPASGEPMRYEEYLRNAPFDLQPPGKSTRPVEDLLEWLEMSPTHEAVKRTLAARTSAYWEAKPAKGRRPVVIYAASLEAPLFENSVLCEYLASHGFIVLGTPNFGARSREVVPPNFEDPDAQAWDIQYRIGFARELPQADAARVAVVGFSGGGLANFIAALRSDQISALVSLDGSIVYYFDYFREKPYFSGIPNLELPVLFALQSESVLAKLPGSQAATRKKFLDEVPHMDAWWVEMRRLGHKNFSSLFNHLWKRKLTEGEPSDDVALEDYDVVCRYVQQFLRVHLMKEESAQGFLEATVEENGPKSEAVAVTRRPARPSPASTLGFARWVRETGFGTVLQTYQAILEKDPKFSLGEGEINRWANQLLVRNRTHEALAAYQLSLHLYPTSNAARLGLGDTHRKLGDHARAQELYRKLVEESPDSGEGFQAKMRLDP